MCGPPMMNKAALSMLYNLGVEDEIGKTLTKVLIKRGGHKTEKFWKENLEHHWKTLCFLNLP